MHPVSTARGGCGRASPAVHCVRDIRLMLWPDSSRGGLPVLPVPCATPVMTGTYG